MKTRGNASNSVRLTCESSDYFLDKEHRARLNTEAARERTFRLLPQPMRQRRPRRWLKVALFTFLLACLVTPLSMARAQGGGQADMAGGEDGNNPALVEYRMGLFHLVREEWRLAIARFDEAVHLLPEYAAAFEARGYCYELAGDFEQATVDYLQAIALEPGYAPTYKLLADLYYAQGERSLALHNYRLYVILADEVLAVAAVERIEELEAAL